MERHKNNERQLVLINRVLVALTVFMTGVAIYAAYQRDEQEKAAIRWRDSYITARNLNNALQHTIERNRK